MPTPTGYTSAYTSAEIDERLGAVPNKQDRLVSGTNIKTINNQSLLGYGNITIQGGGGSTEIPIINHGTSDTTFALTPNVFHVWGEVSSLTLTLAPPSDPDVMADYMFEFESGLTPTTLSLPSTITWASNIMGLSIHAGYVYQVSIVNNIGLWVNMEV